MIDASDKRLLAWLSRLPPRQELVMRMALNGRSKNQGPHWDGRVAALTNELKIHTTAKMAKLLADVREQDRVIDASLAGGVMARPKIIDMHGRRGRVPPGAVYVGRAEPHVRLRKSKWANPFHIGRDGAREEVIAKYREWLPNQPDLMAALPELRGKDLACWCSWPNERCHAEVLLELANSDDR